MESEPTNAQATRVYGPSVALRLRALLNRLLATLSAAVLVPFTILADRRGVIDETVLSLVFAGIAILICAVSAISLFVTPTRIVTTPSSVVLLRGRRRREQWPRRWVRFMEIERGGGFLAWSSGDGVEVRCPYLRPHEREALLADLGATARLRDALPAAEASARRPVLFRPQRSALRWRALVLLLVATEALAAGVLAVALAEDPAGDRTQIALGAGVLALSLPLGLTALRLALRPGLPDAIVVSDSAIQVDGVVFPLESLRTVVASAPTAQRHLRLVLVEMSGRVTEVPLGRSFPTLRADRLFPDYALLLSTLRERTAPRPGLLRIEG
ncbi:MULTISPECIES: hypothetical protein [unclassified Rathayibacter]|uniref:hypothetical protein n=1 Tax=unclassified Rathayibacter TaxID=2609250 RepID=UPI00188D911D|nr:MULTISPECIES: hypothetical protein [unclassified Rathayibacter]MBF4460942.1 hypothetical protein [Rathayibacter sp. VKM Ac-2879]MBF4502353.1 hypothetical protein [Rathayibacter sp. VKM Ac-2878]